MSRSSIAVLWVRLAARVLRQARQPPGGGRGAHHHQRPLRQDVLARTVLPAVVAVVLGALALGGMSVVLLALARLIVQPALLAYESVFPSGPSVR